MPSGNHCWLGFRGDVRIIVRSEGWDEEVGGMGKSPMDGMMMLQKMLAEQPTPPMNLSEMFYRHICHPNSTSTTEIPLERSHLTFPLHILRVLITVRAQKSFFHRYSPGVVNAIKAATSTTLPSLAPVVPGIIRPQPVPSPSWECVTTVPASGYISAHYVPREVAIYGVLNVVGTDTRTRIAMYPPPPFFFVPLS